MTETVMDAAELCRARDLLGYDDAKLAADLGLPPNVVTAWSSGRDVGGLLGSISIGAVLGALYGGGKHLWTRVRSRRIA